MDKFFILNTKEAVESFKTSLDSLRASRVRSDSYQHLMNLLLIEAEEYIAHSEEIVGVIRQHMKNVSFVHTEFSHEIILAFQLKLINYFLFLCLITGQRRIQIPGY